MTNDNMGRRLQIVRPFAADLTQVRLGANKPSFRMLEHMTARHGPVRVSAATLCRMLKGEIVPKWECTEAFLTACGVDQAAIVHRWNPMWRKLQEDLEALRSVNEQTTPTHPPTRGPAASPAMVPNGFTCEACGAWVIDAPLHITWHAEIEQARQPALRAVGDRRPRLLRIPH